MPKKNRSRSAGASAPMQRGAASKRSPRRRRRAGGTISSVVPSLSSTTPGAIVGIVQRNMIWTRFGSAPFSNGASDYGLRLEFRQPISTALLSYNVNGVFGGNSGSTISPSNYFDITPTIPQNSAIPGFPTPFVGIPEAFVRYRFRKVCVEYVANASPYNATTNYVTSGTIVLGYTPDGSAGASVATTGQIRELSKSIEFPIWANTPVVFEVFNDLKHDDPNAPLYYTYAGTASTAESRQDFQGVVIGGVSQMPGGTVVQNVGTFYCSGVLDLYSFANNAEIGLVSESRRQDLSRKFAAMRGELKEERKFAVPSVDEDHDLASKRSVSGVSTDYEVLPTSRLGFAGGVGPSAVAPSLGVAARLVGR